MKKNYVTSLWLATAAAAFTLFAPLEAKDIHEPGETSAPGTVFITTARRTH